MEIKVIGAGGIATHLLPTLCRYLQHTEHAARVVILDGDAYEDGNSSRQDFTRLGNKAEVTSEMLSARFPDLTIAGKPVYLTDDNAFVYVREGDIVLSCVDNHATRGLLSRRLSELSAGVLISGGNDYTDGNVQVYVRKDGENVTPPLTHLHPEIAHPQDRNPADLSCEEQAATGAPQLIFANQTVATVMLNTFWLMASGQALPYTEVYFDLITGAVRPVRRS